MVSAWLQAAVIGLGLAACGSTKPIVVRPQLSDDQLAGVACPKTEVKFYVKDAQDKRGYAEPKEIGFTQTGMLNIKASLWSAPAPTDILKNTLAALLARCGNLAQTTGDGRLILTPSLLGLQITEQTGLFSEKMSASLKYEVVVVDAGSGDRLGRFIALGNATVWGMDTTDQAAKVVEDALRESLTTFAWQMSDYR